MSTAIFTAELLTEVYSCAPQSYRRVSSYVESVRLNTSSLCWETNRKKLSPDAHVYNYVLFGTRQSTKDKIVRHPDMKTGTVYKKNLVQSFLWSH